MEYPLPDTVAGARILREGGNGLVLEVSIKVCQQQLTAVSALTRVSL